MFLLLWILGNLFALLCFYFAYSNRNLEENVYNCKKHKYFHKASPYLNVFGFFLALVTNRHSSQQ